MLKHFITFSRFACQFFGFCLSNISDTIGYHGFEEDFQEAHRLLNDTDRLDNVLNGALSACVFAGMGSWNDEVAAICEDKNIPQHQYTEVTNALFSAILNVVCGICSY